MYVTLREGGNPLQVFLNLKTLDLSSNYNVSMWYSIIDRMPTKGRHKLLQLVLYCVDTGCVEGSFGKNLSRLWEPIDRLIRPTVSRGRDSNLRAVSWTIPPATLWRSESRTRVNFEWPRNADRKTIFEEIETWNFDLRGSKWMICKRSVMIDALIAGGSATWLSKFSKGTNKQNVIERYQSTQHRFLEPMTDGPARSRPCTRTVSRDSYSPLITYLSSDNNADASR